MTGGPQRAARQAEVERNDRALLRAAREVIAADGAHASVAAIATRAGVGIGSLYRRYRSKEALFQHLCELALDQWLDAAQAGLADDDPWEGFAHYVNAGIGVGPGSLAPIAGTIEITAEMAAKAQRADAAIDALVARAHAAGVLRQDVTAVDLALLIEQLSSSPLLEQLDRQGRDDLAEAATDARARICAIALDGLRHAAGGPLPGAPPSARLITERWAPPASGGERATGAAPSP